MGEPVSSLREDRAAALEFLRIDPLRNVGPLGRLGFEGPGWRGFVLGEPVEAVVALGTRPHSGAVVALEGRAAVEALQGLPPGEYHLSLSDINLLTQLKEAFDISWVEEAYLLFLRREDLRPFGDLEPRPVPPAEAAFIASKWEDEDRTDYIRERLEGGPSVGAWDGDKLVGWYGTHVVTDRAVTMGFLHVLEPYRQRGYGKMLATALCRLVLDMGRVPACHVEATNVASLALHAAVGLQRYCRQGWAGITVR